MTATLDIVRAAHKATRRFMFETLVRLGALDVTEHGDVAHTLDLLERLLELLGEDRTGWRDGLHALRQGDAAGRGPAAAALYRDLAELVAQRLPRLLHEEERAEPGGDTLVERLSRLDDAELKSALFWMEGALTPQEMAALLDALHAASSATRFHGALALLAGRMDERRWNPLARSPGIAQVEPAPAAVPA